MKSLSQFLLAAVMTASIVGCGARWKKDVLNTRSYELGMTQSATIGSPMVARETGTVWEWKKRYSRVRPYGGSRSHEESGQHHDDDFVRKEIVYFGKSGNGVEVSYREFHGDSKTPTIVQNVKYDLSESATITFQTYRIQVIEASNESISFRVLSE